MFVDVALEVSQDKSWPLEILLSAVQEVNASATVEQIFGEMLDELVLGYMLNKHEGLVPPPPRLAILASSLSRSRRFWLASRSSSGAEPLREEFAAIKAMNVYKLIPRSSVPAGHRILEWKPVSKRKLNESGEITR
jgi:hypothetical protein